MVVRAFAALVAAVVGVLTPGPAMAMAEETVWHRATCFGGAIDSFEVTEVEAAEPSAEPGVARGRSFLTMSGHLDCGSSDKQATFAYARYDNTSEWGHISRRDLRRYRNGTQTPFTEGRFIQDGPVNFAICVVTDYDVQIACVAVERNGQDLDVGPLQQKSATWGQDVYPVVGVGTDRPACGGCW